MNDEPLHVWYETVTSWLEGVLGEKVPDDADLMPKRMWRYYRDVVVSAGRQCPARRELSIDFGRAVHVCRCVHSWTAHENHRCACSRAWTDPTVNVSTPEDGASL
jgi:hypothetical protein